MGLHCKRWRRYVVYDSTIVGLLSYTTHKRQQFLNLVFHFCVFYLGLACILFLCKLRPLCFYVVSFCLCCVQLL